jgi:methylglutaconyl-CoA hydratase
MADHAHAKLSFLQLAGGGRIARLELNRPEQANAFSSQMMEEITKHALDVAQATDVRALVMSGHGKHFSAGADLNWMQASAKLSYEENVTDATQLRSMFESIANLPIPKIAAVRGATYGGAVGLVACCDFAIATESARFCLSEAKLGLLPAVIAPYLLRKMSPGHLRRLALTSRVFDAKEAKEAGLIEVIATGELDDAVKTELNSLLACGPEAQRAIHKLLNHLRDHAARQGDETVAAISKARTSPEGQSGLASFFTKTNAPWVRILD